MEGIILPPYAPVLMESTRALGYSLESAVADLLDNSISANATNIEIEYRPWDDPYLYIIDNGDGMLPDEITAAMRYGSSNPLDIRDKNDLGRFGLGLKTASLSQCRCLTVISKKDGIISGRRWDLDIISQRQDWVLLKLDQSQMDQIPGMVDLAALDHGTLVIWHKLDRLTSGVASIEDFFPTKMDDVRSHLSLVFHRYLTGETGQKRVEISINKQPIKPLDPFLSGKSEQVMDVEPIIIDGQKITATPYILPHTSRLSSEELKLLGGEDGLRRKQGFYVYRNRRLLVWGTWFRLLRQDELYKLARVKVDIPNSLDHLWTLDIRKSTASPPEVVRKNLDRIVKRIADNSRRTWTFRGRKETTDRINHVWNRNKTREGIRYSINRDHLLVKTLASDIDKSANACFEKILLTIESSIPLNQLYVDLTEDEHFAPETDATTSIRATILEVIDRTDKKQKR
ncbi:hypothetical protein C1G86_1608 [Dehalococcoides mccartyi]|uniref:ATP-binding protein n=1 Tax=Dehalococcoides mccartyi TaxID=61435 RepID=A0A328ENH2_9CHLR|nr:hypothetical protein C1G87_1637 [Dehalococcoides mccartyi]RAL70077.1 hypothetical protein C1G86_1608 [Dehalococcoides mccartyi]